MHFKPEFCSRRLNIVLAYVFKKLSVKFFSNCVKVIVKKLGMYGYFWKYSKIF